MSNNFINSDNEIIFSNSTLSLTENDDDLVSDKVNILANGIYEEFENLIRLYGQGTVDGLMPLVVTILETMDKLYTCKDDLSLQLDLMKEDQCQLYTQYEREKLSRKLAEEKINHLEDQYDEERQHFENRIELLESNNKMGEMKIQNYLDSISRNEERELEMRKELSTLQQRYSELLRAKADHKIRNINSQCTTDEISSGCQSPQLSVKHKPEKAIKNSSSLKSHRHDSESHTDKVVPFLIEPKMSDQSSDINELSVKDEFGDVSKFEERELEMRKEITNLQQRYSELMRTKADYKYRNINSQSTTDEISSGCQNLQLPTRHKSGKIIKNTISSTSHRHEAESHSDKIEPKMSDQISAKNELSLKDEFGDDWNNENVLAQVPEVQPMADFNPMLEFDMDEEGFDNTCQAENEIRIDNEEIYLEHDFDDLDMSKEIAFLLKENQDLNETKNALNVVKDDLITKVDELTGELCVLREEVKNSNLLKFKYRDQSKDLAKKLSEVSQKLQEKESKLSELGEDENLIECAVNQNGIQTKTKFTRAEMSRILSERNKYKEDLLELQETMRYQMVFINQKNRRPKKDSMWNFFSNVISNATAFTTGAIIGSGNEMEIAQLNRNFTNCNREAITLKDDSGTCITLPNLSNQSNAFRKRPTPGLPMRVTNPLFSPIDENNQPMVKLVPLDEMERKSSKHKDVDNSSV